MSITLDNVLMFTDAQLHTISPRGVVAFELSDTDDMVSLRRYLERHGGEANLRLVVLTGEGEAAPEPDPMPYQAEAEQIRASGFLASLPVAEALGTDAEYDRWVTYQPSIVSGAYSETDDAGDGRCVACHVRRAGPAGTAHKPAYHQVPMTDDEHSRQHQGGEIAVYVRWARQHGQPIAPNRAAAHAWFDARLIETRSRWVEQRLCAELNAADLAEIAPLDLVTWAREHGVLDALPALEGMPQ